MKSLSGSPPRRRYDITIAAVSLAIVLAVVPWPSGSAARAQTTGTPPGNDAQPASPPSPSARQAPTAPDPGASPGTVEGETDTQSAPGSQSPRWRNQPGGCRFREQPLELIV
ncbi:MAG: hypothetical protein ACK5JT_02700 [Hyphomicrobiaceae bacterium]